MICLHEKKKISVNYFRGVFKLENSIIRIYCAVKNLINK